MYARSFAGAIYPLINSTSDFDLYCNLNTHNQQFPHQTLFLRLLKQLVTAYETKEENLIEAVMMMLPPLVSFPLDGLVTCIAAEANLAARKHLVGC
jgi:hypothetical protein